VLAFPQSSLVLNASLYLFSFWTLPPFIQP
jgi:hypothetical protein